MHAIAHRPASAFARTLGDLLSAFQEFYDAEKPDMISVLCSRLPLTVSALGRAIISEILSEERGHLG